MQVDVAEVWLAHLMCENYTKICQGLFGVAPSLPLVVLKPTQLHPLAHRTMQITKKILAEESQKVS